MQQLIAQGAEALLVRKDDLLIKRRIKKSYRNITIDNNIRKTRTKREARIMEKVSSLINVPEIIRVDEKNHEIVMGFVPGKILSEYLDELKNAEEACKEIGKQVALMHAHDIIHGDLTTSNMILHGNKVYFIDFGLAFHSSRAEDKAVDLHLLRQALESKHFKKWPEFFAVILAEYEKTNKTAKAVLERFKKVESRGRYKGKTKGKGKTQKQ